MRWHAVAAGAVLLLGCQTPPPEPTPTPTPAEATTPPEQTPQTPTPEPAEPTEPLTGSVRVEDPAGDVTDDGGHPPAEPEPAADLRAVELVGDGAGLEITFELDGPVPDSADSLLWSVELFADGEALYIVTAQLVGARLVAAVLDWQTTEQHPLPDPPQVEGTLLTLVVPADLLPRIDGPFEWTALTQLDGAYEDRLEGRSRFP